MKDLLPANRVAAIAAFLTGLAAAVLAITNTFPKNWQQTTVAIAGLLGAIGAALHFMLGSQKMDQNISNEKVAQLNLKTATEQPQVALVTNGSSTIEEVTIGGTPVTDVTDVTGGLNINPDYNPGNALNPEPDVTSIATPPATADQAE